MSKKEKITRSIIVVVILLVIAIFDLGDNDDTKTSAPMEVAAEKVATEKAAVEISRIEKELKSIPMSEYKKNLVLYRKLVTLDPSNSQYINKVSFYEDKIKAAAEQPSAEQTAWLIDTLKRKDVDLQMAYELGLCEQAAYQTLIKTSETKDYDNLLYKQILKLTDVVDFDKAAKELLLYTDSLCGTGKTFKEFYTKITNEKYECIKNEVPAFGAWVQAHSDKGLRSKNLDRLVQVEAISCRTYFHY